MTTTIQVQEDTLELLKQLRAVTKSETYDSTIKEVLKQSGNKEKSMYGFLGKKNMKQILKGLRDESDRL